ncbi:hypothetical protein KUL152_24810 [Tenacibaculum sp. KUL152]|nr:hypothetical protein KUL152_24810 [Tenacibaculum sp. KUL152]
MSVRRLYQSTTPLKKDQVYNWFDRYKPQSETKIYTIRNDVKPKESFVQRFVRRTVDEY